MQKDFRFKLLGFSLLEILVSIALIAILAGIGYPSYQSYLIRSHRTEGQTALLDLANRMEEYYAQHNNYQGVSLDELGIPSATAHHYYQLFIQVTSPTSYLLLAQAKEPQAQQDQGCEVLTYDSYGNKNSQGQNAQQDCWG